MSKTGSYRPPAAPKYTPTAGMRKATSTSMRKLAAKLREDHQGIGTHAHVTDAARALDRGDHEAAVRHLNAAVATMTPQSVHRHGFTNDEDHMKAKASMDAIHRHVLLVKDIQGMHERNQALPRAEAEPNAAKPSPPPGMSDSQAMNAPGKADGGGSDPGAALPKSVTKWEVTKQIAASRSGDLTTTIELADGAGTPRGSFRMSPAPQDRYDFPVELAHHYNPAQPRDKHGRWGNIGLNVGKGGFTAPGAHDPTSMIGVGGGRKNWAAENSQMPDARVRKDFPQIARRERLLTPMRTYQAQLDETRIASGQKPLHPELAEIFPGVYAKAGITARPGTLSVPREARVRPDSVKVTGLDAPQVTKIKIALRRKLAQQGRGLEYGTTVLSGSAPGIELSAKTGTLAITPHPFGSPSGPGLWHQKGMQLPPYVQNIAHALLRTGRAKSEGQAIAMARAATKRWMSGGGHVHPEVRAAAAASDAQWRAKQARAHAHANARAAIELVGTAAGAAKDSRVPAGGPLGGTFGSGGGSTSQATSSSSGPRATKGTQSKAAPQTSSSNAQKKAALLKQAAGYRAKADALIKQRDALRAALASASGKTSNGQKGAKTSSGAGKTKSSAPKSTAAAGSSAKSSTTAKTAATTAKTAATSTKKASSAASKVQVLAQISALNAQILQLQAAYRTAMAQAAKL